MVSMAMLSASIACSGDDDGGNNCRTCDYFNGEEITLCDEGNGTMSVSVGGETEIVDLEGESFEEVAEGVCTLGDFDFDFDFGAKK